MVCLFFNITRQVAICLFTRGRRSSLHQVDNQYTCQITTWAAFSTEMSSSVYPCGCGWERDGSTCAVRAPLLFVHFPHLRGCVCERDTNLRIMRRPSPCLHPVQPPVTTTAPRPTPPHLISHISPSIFIYKGPLSKLQFADIQGH